MDQKFMPLVLIIFFFLTSFGYGQNWPSVDSIVAKMQAKMELSEDQLIRVRQIIKENMAERQEIKPQLVGGLTQAQAEPLDTELYMKLSNVLTRAQMNRWDRIHQGILDNTDMDS